jgi:hypothetical protein
MISKQHLKSYHIYYCNSSLSPSTITRIGFNNIFILIAHPFQDLNWRIWPYSKWFQYFSITMLSDKKNNWNLYFFYFKNIKIHSKTISNTFILCLHIFNKKYFYFFYICLLYFRALTKNNIITWIKYLWTKKKKQKDTIHT